MNVNLKGVWAAGAMILLAAGNAQAQLNDGTDGSFSTDLFISVVERDATTNTAVANLIIGIEGTNALDFSDNGTAWSTTAAQEQDILNFINAATGTISFNVGAALTDQSFGTDLQAAITSGNSQGPAFDGFSALGTAITKIQSQISNANNGSFNANGVLLAADSSQFGFHDFAWGNNIGGGIQPSNEVAFGASSVMQQWRLDLNQGGIIQSFIGGDLGLLTSDLATGDISFSVVPVPAAVWLFGSALGLLGWVRRRAAA